MAIEDEPTVVHIEFPQNHSPEPGELTDVERIELDCVELDRAVRRAREHMGNTIGLRRLDAIDNGDIS